jgi:uncharacterized protein with PIN domain
MKDTLTAGWGALIEEITSGIKDWRTANPRATFKEMELELDKRFAKAKAKLLTDMALASPAADISSTEKEERPVCRECGGKLQSLGRRKRKLRGQHDAETELNRSYARCSACGAEYFPPG